MVDGTVESVESTSDVVEPERESSTAATLFDIRMVIGGVFLLYGLLLSGAGMFPTEQALEKAQGININLWTGLAMLVVAGMFLLWLKLRPLNPPAKSHARDHQGDEESEHVR